MREIITTEEPTRTHDDVLSGDRPEILYSSLGS